MSKTDEILDTLIYDVNNPKIRGNFTKQYNMYLPGNTYVTDSIGCQVGKFWFYLDSPTEPNMDTYSIRELVNHWLSAASNPSPAFIQSISTDSMAHKYIDVSHRPLIPTKDLKLAITMRFRPQYRIYIAEYVAGCILEKKLISV